MSKKRDTELFYRLVCVIWAIAITICGTVLLSKVIDTYSSPEYDLGKPVNVYQEEIVSPNPLPEVVIGNVDTDEVIKLVEEVVIGVGAAITGLYSIVLYIRKKIEGKKDEQKMKLQTQEIKEYIDKCFKDIKGSSNEQDE